MNYAVQFEKVTKRYRKGEHGYGSLRDAVAHFFDGHASRHAGITALDNVSFEVKEGEIFGIIGPNGSGKTTILRLIYRTTFPTEGTIRIRGRVGALIEIGTGLHPELTGRENIHFYGRLLGMSQQEVKRSFDAIVEFAETGAVLDTPLKRYSAGMQLRLWFSIVSHFKPEVLLVDETLSVGDAAFQRKCTRRIHEMIREGSTVILVSHDLSLIEKLCNHILFLAGGKAQCLGDSEGSLAAYMNWLQSRNGQFAETSTTGELQGVKTALTPAPGRPDRLPDEEA